MPILKLLLCAKDISVDQQSNNVSVFTVLEDINVDESTPADGSHGLAPIVLLSVWEMDVAEEKDGNFEQKIRLINPDGSNQTVEVGQFVLARKRHRMYINLQGLPFRGFGKLTFEVYLKAAGKSYRDTPHGAYWVDLNPLKNQAQLSSVKSVQ